MAITAEVAAALDLVEKKYADYQAALAGLATAHSKLQADQAARPAKVAAAEKAADELAERP